MTPSDLGGTPSDPWLPDQTISSPPVHTGWIPSRVGPGGIGSWRQPSISVNQRAGYGWRRTEPVQDAASVAHPSPARSGRHVVDARSRAAAARSGGFAVADQITTASGPVQTSG